MRQSRVVAALAVLLIGTTASSGVGPRSKCDNQKSMLCDGLVAIYQFEEGLDSATTPTFPDAVRKDSFGLSDLYEPNGIDVGGGSIQSGINNGKLGVNIGATTTPDQVSGLKLWLKADAITGLNDGDAVGSWPDSSGNAYNATQATASLKPILKTGIVNGKPVVRFDGTDDLLATSATITNFITNTTGNIFVVYKRTSGADMINDVGDYIALRHTGTNQRAYNWDGSSDNADKAATSGAWTIGLWRHNGGNVYVGVNDARDLSLVSVASGNTQVMNNVLRIGAHAYSSARFNGDIAEVVAYNVNLTEDDRKKVETYLAEKYGITIPYSSGGTPGPDADAVAFDGATQYLHTGLDGSGVGILGNSYWTMAFWVYAEDSGISGQYQYIWSEKGKENNGDRLGTDIYLYNNAGTFAPRVTVYDAITLAATTASWATNMSTDAWHLVVVTYRPRTVFGNGELTIQVDNGTRVTQAISGEGILTGVGSVVGRSASGPTGWFYGRLDQLTLSGVAWTTTDSASFWNGGNGREYPFVGN